MVAQWRCPKCGRSFVQRGARHACVRRTVAAFFKGHPKPHALFRAVRPVVEALGDVEVEVTLSQIAFKARTRFAWVWMPQKWLRKAPADALVLTFELEAPLDSPRIKEQVEARPGRWTHHLVLHDAAQLDDEVRRWLQRAFALGSRPTAPRSGASPKDAAS